MQRRIGDITIESIAAESVKFAAPMVLVHGLWCSAAVWRKCMGYLAHRGWTCHAINLRGHGDAGGRDAVARSSIGDYLSDVQRVIASCEAAPVVIGHDLGGLLALACPPATTLAVVALAPLVPEVIGGTANPALRGWGAWLPMLRLRPLPPPRGKLGAEYFAETAPGGTSVDSARVARELRADVSHLPARGGTPTLLVAGERDPFCPPQAVEGLARHVGAQCLTVERAGHAMPWERGWEQRVATIHRWLIQTLGEPLLLLREDEDQ